MRGCEKIIVALKKECWKRWNGAVSLIIWLLSDDPGLWAVLGNNIILYGVLHRLDSDEHLIRLLSSLWSTRLGLWCYLKSDVWTLRSQCYNHTIRPRSISWRPGCGSRGVSPCHLPHDGHGGMLKCKSVGSSPSMTLSEAASTRRWKDCHLSLLTVWRNHVQMFSRRPGPWMDISISSLRFPL